MKKEQKAETIDTLEETFNKSSVGVLTDYRGLTNMEITALRRRIQAAGGDYKVVKNTLARFAAERAGIEELAGQLKGPVAIAFGYDDITSAPKALAAWLNETKIEMEIKGGFYGDRVLSAKDVMTLSTLPPREVLIARVLGQMNAPISGLVNCLAGPMRGLAQVLQAQIQKMEEE